MSCKFCNNFSCQCEELAVARGWRWCPAGHGHLWNAATKAIALHPHPTHPKRCVHEPCEAHRKKSTWEKSATMMSKAVAQAEALRERVRHAALTGSAMIISGAEAKILLRLIQRED